MTEKLRVGVIGVGELGSRHARIYDELAGAELVGVADIDPVRCAAISKAYGVRAVADFRELVPDVQAASVAVPTVDHEAVTLALLDAGVHVLVEKPIASTLDQARAMTVRAREREVCLAVGHTERYNPAVVAVLEQVGDPRFIEVHRLGSFSPRSLDIDVVLDLMIHDLDVVRQLVGRDVVSVEAVGVAVLTPRVDIANARLRFEGGAVANITASRVSQEKTRKLRIFERDRYVSLDYQAQEAVCFQLVSAGEGQRPNIQKDDLSVANEEPLKYELEDFIEAAATGRKPRVGGDDATAALELALRVVGAMAGADSAN
jgi:predicted dehydrogenase